MTPLLRSAILTCCFLILTGCASSGTPKWRQFHGNPAGQGYIPVESGFALSSAWVAGPYKLTSSSPVIGNDINGKQIVYIGTVDGELPPLLLDVLQQEEELHHSRFHLALPLSSQMESTSGSTFPEQPPV